MFFDPANYKHPAFKEGMRDISSVAPGIWAWGLMTGVAMVQSGLSVEVAAAMTLLVYAGSSQLAVTPMLAAGAPFWVVLATAFCVNLRFVVFSLHMRPYLLHLPRLERVLQGYLTADLSYVLFIRRFTKPGHTLLDKEMQSAFLAGSTCAVWVTWMVASFFGILLVNIIPSAWGLGFAGTLCLVGILCSLATNRLRILTATVAAITAIAAYHLPLKLNIVMAIAVAVVMSMSLERFENKSQGRGA
jgi:predicted branched-subunit amino acid permease